MGIDPLEAIESLSIEAQNAVIVSVLRSTRNTLSRVERKVDWVLRALWTLITTIIVGILIFLVTSHVRPVQPSKSLPLKQRSAVTHANWQQPVFVIRSEGVKRPR